jgi:hypothetical protein
MKALLSASALAFGLAATNAHSSTYNFETLTVPGVTPSPNEYLSVYSINDLGQAIINGSEANVSYNYTNVNDLYDIKTNTYTTLPAYPGATTNSTAASAINNAGVIVGDYHATGIDWGGFVLAGGSFSSVTYPPGSIYSYPLGISNNGEVTGTWFDGTNLHGYVEVGGGAFTELDVPSSWGADTFPEGVNVSGTVVGDFTVAGGDDFATKPFVWSGGVFSEGALPPGYAYGGYVTINDEGLIAGYASNDPVNNTDGIGFIDNGGVFTEISDPLGVRGTYIYALNNAGVIGGTYVDADGNWQAFLATPVPEAPTWVAMLAGFAGLSLTGLWGRRGVAPLV